MHVRRKNSVFLETTHASYLQLLQNINLIISHFSISPNFLFQIKI